MYGIGGLVEIGVVEDEDGTIAAEFESYLFQAVGADFGDELADTRAAGEGNFLDVGMAAKGLAEAGRVVQIRREDVEDARLEAGFLS